MCWTQNEGDPAQAGSYGEALHLSVPRLGNNELLKVMATASPLPSKSLLPIPTQGRDSRNHSSQFDQVSSEQSSTAGNRRQPLSEEHGFEEREREEKAGGVHGKLHGGGTAFTERQQKNMILRMGKGMSKDFLFKCGCFLYFSVCSKCILLSQNTDRTLDVVWGQRDTNSLVLGLTLTLGETDPRSCCPHP